jgi:hypothetical protein
MFLPMNLWSFSNTARVSSSLRGRILTNSSWGYGDSIEKGLGWMSILYACVVLSANVSVN